MPIYEFRCNDCGHEFEEWFRSGSEVSHALCPACESSHLMRLLSVFGVRTHPARQCPLENSVENLPCKTCGKQSPSPCSLESS